jgi:hypothetical protein
MSYLDHLESVPSQIQAQLNQYGDEKKRGESSSITLFCQLVGQIALNHPQWLLSSIKYFSREASDLKDIFSAAEKDQQFLCVKNLIDMIFQYLNSQKSPALQTIIDSSDKKKVQDQQAALRNMMSYFMHYGISLTGCLVCVLLRSFIGITESSSSTKSNICNVSAFGFGVWAMYSGYQGFFNYRKPAEVHLEIMDRVFSSQDSVIATYLEQLTEISQGRKESFKYRRI